MPRRQFTFTPGCYYHMYNRGANRKTIFGDQENYLFSLRLLKEYRERLNITVIAYCHMPNHYHWLVRQDGPAPAWLLPQRVWKQYSSAYNHSNRHSGTLFQGPYQAIPVNDDDYLRQLCRYIHANPVHHAIAATPGAWPYSNYLDWIGKRKGTLLDRTFIEAIFGSAEEYLEYMNTYLCGQPTVPPWLKAQLRAIREDPYKG